MNFLNKRILAFALAALPVLCSAQITGTLFNKKKKKEKYSPFAEQVDFEGMVKRYLMKDSEPMERLEGIYSVSAIISKRGGFLSNPNREKIIARKDNYAKVVIIKDSDNPKREYIEVSLGSKIPGKYPIVGEFTSLSEGRAFVYEHFEPKTDGVEFSFVSSEFDILDGVRTEVVKRKTVTYKLSYLKVYPKKDEILTKKLSSNQ